MSKNLLHEQSSVTFVQIAKQDGERTSHYLIEAMKLPFDLIVDSMFENAVLLQLGLL